MQYMPSKKVPLPLRIDPELLVRVDKARGDVSRTRWVERALESALTDQRVSGLLEHAVDRASEPSTADINGPRSYPSGSSAPTRTSSNSRSRQAPSLKDTWSR